MDPDSFPGPAPADSADVDEDIDSLIARLEKISPPLVTLMAHALGEIKKTIQYTTLAGVARPILFHPLMISGHNTYFKGGVCFEVVRRSKRSDILAAGGRLANRAIDRFKLINDKP